MAEKSIRCKACKQLKTAEDELRAEQARLVERSEELVHVKKQVDEAYRKLASQKEQVNAAFTELNLVNSRLGPKSMSVIELRDFIKDVRNEAKKQKNDKLENECVAVLEKWT